MKKLFLSVSISIQLFAQAEYVPVDNRVYDFLERMSIHHFLENYNSFEVPKTRMEIANHLTSLNNKSSQLDEVDQLILNDLRSEFEYEMVGTLEKCKSILGKNSYNFFSEDEKYLFHFSKKSMMNLFINLNFEAETISSNLNPANKFNSAFLFNVGGEMRGTLLDKVGFYLKGMNGVAKGNYDAALQKKELRYNFKFNERPNEAFFDETEGYLTANFNLVKLKLGRDRVNAGYGTNKIILGNNSPLFDYLSFNVNYDFFSFSYLHGKLLGKNSVIEDSISGTFNYLPEKYFAYHRLGFNVSENFNFGLGEAVVYGERSMDLSYLIPFTFFKSVEHSNRDRDNTMLFFDASSLHIPATKIFLIFLIDDIDFGKIGKGWWGNQTIFNLGLQSSPFYKILPIDFKLEYLRIEPYTYSHRLNRNSFTNYGYNLSSFMHPNSELIFFGINYRFTHRLTLTADFSFTQHGANVTNLDGTIKNVGGDINLGHRNFDAESIKFLDGNLEITRKYSASVQYEPVNQIFFYINAAFNSLSKMQNQSQHDSHIFIGTKLKF